jgi:hypothetical protein
VGMTRVGLHAGSLPHFGGKRVQRRAKTRVET